MKKRIPAILLGIAMLAVLSTASYAINPQPEPPGLPIWIWISIILGL